MYSLRGSVNVQKCKQLLPRNPEHRKEAVGVDRLGEIAGKEREEENGKSKTARCSHGPTLSRERGKVVRG